MHRPRPHADKSRFFGSGFYWKPPLITAYPTSASGQGPTSPQTGWLVAIVSAIASLDSGQAADIIPHREVSDYAVLAYSNGRMVVSRFMRKLVCKL